MYTVQAFLVCKPGISIEQFRERCERRHVPLTGRSTPPMRAYRRNDLNREEPFARAVDQIGFDVVTEMEFDDRAAFKRWFDALQVSDVTDLAAEDGERSIDSPTMTACPVVIEQAVR